MKFIPKTYLIKLLTLISITLFNYSSFAQPLDTLDIVSKVDYIINNSNKYKEFKVVKKTWLLDLKSHLTDSLEVQTTASAKTNKKIGTQKEEIESLKQTIAETNSVLTNANSAKDKISILGMSLDKGTYNALMFSTIIVLLVLLLVYILRFRTSNRSTVETKKNYGILDNEFELYKRSALDKEQKLKRQLQDEINKNSRLANNS